MNKYELYEQNKNKKGFEAMGDCFIANGELFVYTLVGDGTLLEETEDHKRYASEFKLIDVCGGNRWDNRDIGKMTIEDVVNMMEESYEENHSSVVYIGKPVFDMNLEGFDFVTLNVDYNGMETRD